MSSNLPTPHVQGVPITHTFSLTDKHGRTWVTLNITCIERSDLGDKHLPYLLEGETLTGSLDLDLPEETTIKSIKVSVSELLAYMRMDLLPIRSVDW